MVAKFSIIGRATRDAELTTTSNGTKRAKILLAANEKDKSYYYTLIAFNEKAELCEKYVKKGKQVYFDGSILPRSYEKDGEKIHITDYVVQHVEFLGSNSQSTTEPNPDDVF